MSAIKVNFEIGHEASVRTKKTPEGFTHDWEVFVRGPEGADISGFVDKVVFHLHETFPKPKRVVKEPPFSIKESGYAGFMFPIEIYLKNRDDPKKIKFTYDLTLQQSSILKDRYVFQHPNEEFRKKLLKGGGIIVNNNAFYTNPDQENRSRDSFTDEKPPVTKPKVPSEPVKKHKSKEHKEDVSHKTSNFENLFGPPIQKPSKVSPDPKKLDKNATVTKPEKKEKDRSSSDKPKSKHEHKEVKPEKVKNRDEKDKSKMEKSKSHKDPERSKDKSNKRPGSPVKTPDSAKKKCLSPKRSSSPAVRSSSASSVKEEYKPKLNFDVFEQKKPQKTEEKPTEAKPEKESKEKKKKKSHDRDKERKEKKEHKKDSHKIKESPKDSPREIPKEIVKPKELPKEKEVVKETQQVKDKPIKPDKPINKFSIENLKKTPQDTNERYEDNRVKEKGDSERKHKHKKKDKKRDESREKHKDSSKEKKHKHDKIRDAPIEKPEPVERRETPIPKERPILEPGSPISIDTASQCSSKSGIVKASHIAEEINSSHSDSDESADEEELKTKAMSRSPEPPKERPPSPEPEPEHKPAPEPPVPPAPPSPPAHKPKSKRHKDKSAKREEKKRKRKAADEEGGDGRKAGKLERPSSAEGEASGRSETKVQDNGVSSSLGEDADPGDLSPNYMVQLRGLQQRIMTIKSNEELERVVNLIAETGRYEVNTQTFDFDLCLLDRSTVLQLIQLVGC